jgi:protein-S-isoprenylcysteine O-methyltransferase Ste14
MFKDPGHWFPTTLFSNVFGVLVVLIFLMDFLVPRLNARSPQKPVQRRDRGSYLLIYFATLIGLATGIKLRYSNLGTLTGIFQYLGLFVMLVGSLLRNWALISLGKYFSRVVEIESEHRIITGGPYHWLRHPSYTGMILVNVGVLMAIGTWLGALIVLILILAATLYRIRIEENLLIETFKDEYRRYMAHTWLLFPGW